MDLWSLQKDHYESRETLVSTLVPKDPKGIYLVSG